LFIGTIGGNRIRRVDALNNKISTLSLNGATTNAGRPYSIVSRPSGFLFWASNSGGVATGYKVFKVNLATNVAEVVAGIGTNGSAGDGGPATAAQLNNPAGLAFDSAGNMFIGSSSSTEVRRVDAITGIITTVPGT
jgi:hypothetical protein